MNTINWQATCCGHHGEYAEHPLKAGGVARLKRTPGVDTWQVCRFGADNRAIDKDADGVPAYVEMVDADALALLA
jgi:hypothetical protein